MSLLVALVLSALVGTGGLLIAARRGVDGIARLDGMGALLSSRSSRFENFLMVGSDSRAGGDPNTGVDDVTGSRSDTIMILHRATDTGRVSLLSIPRDLAVEIPGRGVDRINSAYAVSPATLVATVRESLGIPVHHYVEVDFVGFTALVDAIGGVDLCFDAPTRDGNTGLNIPEPGCHHLDGTMALAFARSRHYEQYTNGAWHEDATQDLGRTRRQQTFVDTALRTALTQVKANPMRAGDLIRAIGSALTIDDDLDPFSAAGSLREAVGAGIETDSLPVRGIKLGSKAVLELADGAEAILDYYRGDGPEPQRG